MKKLDKLIITAFISPFLLTFFVVVFILLTVYLLSYLDDMIGKNLGFAVFSELIFYFSINMMPVALPLAVLLSSLMTYGNLGEHHELTAIKSSGITLIRVMLPVFISVAVLTIGAFYFNNIIVPKANLKAFSLLYDIRQKRPAVDFKEGAFYNGLPGYSIKVSKKFPDGKTIKGVMIYNHTGGKGNTDLIVADSGKVYTFNHEQYLALELFNGYSYTEYADNISNLYTKDFIKNHFKKSKLVFSLSGFSRTPEELFKGNKKMKNVVQLQKDTDSIRTEYKVVKEQISKNVLPVYMYGLFSADTNKSPVVPKEKQYTKSDIAIILNRATNQARTIKAYTTSNIERLKYLREDANDYEIEMHRKYTQSVACLILFLIGAPLGAIIRKGGFGVPVLISIIFFILLYVLSIIGEKMAKENVIPIWMGMWAANIILFPIGLFFMRQAKNDSRIFETDFYNVIAGKIAHLFKQKMLKAKI
ncbi:MAG TPA: LptF/LptG family permease [Cytophagaceae bacterium]|jgi:lipopolysaccharide export system permease protein|nr:LptF/LptG family permease [Cytophagaceae bacterium]